MKERDWSCGADYRRRVRKLMLQKDIRPIIKLDNQKDSLKGRYSVVEHRRNGGGSHYFVHSSWNTREEAEKGINEVWESIYMFSDAYGATELNDEFHLGKTFKFFNFAKIPDIIGFAVTVEYDFDEEFANNNRLLMIRRRHRIEDMWNGEMRITGECEPGNPPPPIE